MERDEGLRTLECLRARLLAERQASKTAKEDAELMGNKVRSSFINLNVKGKKIRSFCLFYWTAGNRT